MRLAIAHNVQCAGVAHNILGFVQDEAGIEYGDSTIAEQWCTLVLPMDHPAAALVDNKRVLQIEDGETRPEYRIEKIHDSLVTQRVTIEAAPIIHDLAKIQIVQILGGVERHVITTGELTPEQQIDNYVVPALAAAGITWIVKGTITPTTPRALTLDHQTVLGLLRELVVGSNCEVILRRNGDTDYRIDLVRLNDTATKPLAMVGQNVTALERDRDSDALFTVAQPTGLTPSGALEAATVAGTVLEVTARTGTAVTVVDPRDGGDMIAGDDQLNGLFLTVPAVFVAGTHVGDQAGMQPRYAGLAAYAALKDRLYVFNTYQYAYAHEIHPATGELLAYIDNSVLTVDVNGIKAAAYVPKGASGKVWLWVGATGDKIIELDCAAHTVATVRASGAVIPHTRPIYHSGQDAVYYVNGTNVHKYEADSPFTASSFAIGNTGTSMAYVSSVSLFYLTTNVASPAFRTYDPSTDGFASITPTGAVPYWQVEYDSGEDRIIATATATLRIDLIDPAGTDTITDTLTVTMAEGQSLSALSWGQNIAVSGALVMTWSLAGGGMAWFFMRNTTDGRFSVAQVDVAAATAIQLDNSADIAATSPAVSNSPFAAAPLFVGYDAARDVMYVTHGGACFGLNPSHGCFESRVAITDTTDATNQVTVADREELFEAGVLVGLARDADGTRLTTMPHAGAVAQYGQLTALMDAPTFRGERNLVRDPYCNEWFSTQWPKYPSHSWYQENFESGTRTNDIRAQWDEYPIATPDVHAFQAAGAQAVSATTLTLDNGPLNTVIPAGSRVFELGNYYEVLRRAVTDGSGAVTLYIRNNGLSSGFADNAAVNVYVPPLGGAAPNGIATYTQWMNYHPLGRWSVMPSTLPNANAPSEITTTRIRFGGYWGGRMDTNFQLIIAGRPGQFALADRVLFTDEFEYPDGVRFVEATVTARRGPGVYFDGVVLRGPGIPSWQTHPYILVLDRVGVMVNYEPGATGGAPFTEHSHANQLWAVGTEMLDVGRTPAVSYELEVIESDPLRPFLLGAHVDLRDSERGIFTTTPRISNRRYVELTQHGATVRRPVLTVDTKLPTLAHLAAGPPGELSGGGVPVDVPQVPGPGGGGGETVPTTPTEPPADTTDTTDAAVVDWELGYFTQ